MTSGRVIEVRSAFHSPDELRRQLEAEALTEVRLEVQAKERAVFRGVDPAVLVAIATGVSSVLGVLVGGLLKRGGDNARRKIVVRADDRILVEFPADIDADALREKIAAVKELEPTRIELVAR